MAQVAAARSVFMSPLLLTQKIPARWASPDATRPAIKVSNCFPAVRVAVTWIARTAHLKARIGTHHAEALALKSTGYEILKFEASAVTARRRDGFVREQPLEVQCRDVGLKCPASNNYGMSQK